MQSSFVLLLVLALHRRSDGIVVPAQAVQADDILAITMTKHLLIIDPSLRLEHLNTAQCGKPAQDIYTIFHSPLIFNG
nr:hypothetical protein L321_13496 [Pseudomonas plecoglossicida NB2011]